MISQRADIPNMAIPGIDLQLWAHNLYLLTLSLQETTNQKKVSLKEGQES